MRQTNECPTCGEHAVTRGSVKVDRRTSIEVEKCSSCGRTADLSGKEVPLPLLGSRFRPRRSPVPKRPRR